jgi:putative transposase
LRSAGQAAGSVSQDAARRQWLGSALIAEALSSSRRTARSWFSRDRDRGFNGLAPGKSKGHAPRLDPSRHAEFIARVRAGPREDDGVCTLRAKDARDILEREFGVVYTVKGVCDLMHRLGLSCLKPRPRHERGDPEAMRKFKDETAPSLSRP